MKLKQSVKPFRKGTTICFRPDETIFSGGIEFDYSLLSSRLRELAYLNGGVKIVFRDERNELSDGFSEKKFTYIKEVLKNMFNMNAEKDSIHPEIIYVDSQKKTYMSRRLCNGVQMYSDNILGFANNIRTIDGGTHIEGLKTVLTRTFNSPAKKEAKEKKLKKI